jgi:hypothetical protein
MKCVICKSRVVRKFDLLTNLRIHGFVLILYVESSHVIQWLIPWLYYHTAFMSIHGMDPTRPAGITRVISARFQHKDNLVQLVFI